MNLTQLEKYRDADLEGMLSEGLEEGESLAAGRVKDLGFVVTYAVTGEYMVSLTKSKGVVTQKNAREFFQMIGGDHRKNEVCHPAPETRAWVSE